MVNYKSKVKVNDVELYQCPYELAIKCSMSDPCPGCETWSHYMKDPPVKQLSTLQDEIRCLFGKRWLPRSIEDRLIKMVNKFE